MDAKELKEKLTIENIISLMEILGADFIKSSNDNEICFKTICHCGDSHKLYFYKDSKSFHCYSNCGQMDILNIVQQVLELSLTEAISYVCKTFNIHNKDYSMNVGFDDEVFSEDWDYFEKLFKEEKQIDKDRTFKILNEELLERFYRYYHPAFYNDGISFKTLDKFGIRYDILNRRIIIPHWDEMNNLIAIRCRNLDVELVEEGKKYSPIIINGILLSAKTTKYLYGLNFNIENIKKSKKIIILESEKAVMQLDSILGSENNIGVALSSSSLSVLQVELIKSLGVEEVILALDKEYEKYGTIEEKKYAMKIRKSIIDKLIPFFEVSVIWDKEDLIGLKDSPTDKGKNVFLELYKRRIRI